MFSPSPLGILMVLSSAVTTHHLTFILYPSSRFKPRNKTAPTARSIPSISLASTRLSTSLSLLQSSTQRHSTQLSSIEKELVGLDTQEKELREEVERVERKKEWMEEFRGWVELLGGFLEEKVSVVWCL